MSDYKENKYYYLYFIFFIFFILVDDNIHFFFFFSSRRRHTIWNCDWSSDVCASDLIAGMESMKKVGRVGGMALLYFEIVSTLAMFIGLVVGNVVRPGDGFNVNPATLDAKAVADYAGQAKAQSVTDF